MQPTTTNDVQATTEYELFGLIGPNRTVDKGHVNTIKQSLEEDGNWLMNSPIIVNGRFEVIDGQHRLEAAKELRLPVYFRILDGLTIQDARKMNIRHKGWKSYDYLKSYADEGRIPYVKLRTLKEENPEVSLSVLIVYSLGSNVAGYNKNFREGTLENFDIEKARTRLRKLAQLAELNSSFRTKEVSRALLTMMGTPGYSHARMVRKMTNLGEGGYQAMMTYNDNLRALEDLYNRYVQGANKLRFY
jgi:hypothetical protein